MIFHSLNPSRIYSKALCSGMKSIKLYFILILNNIEKGDVILQSLLRYKDDNHS